MFPAKFLLSIVGIRLSVVFSDPPSVSVYLGTTTTLAWYNEQLLKLNVRYEAM